MPFAFKLNNGVKVLAKKLASDELVPFHYVNRTQAANKVEKAKSDGVSCSVYQSPNSRVFYVRLEDSV